MKIMHAELCVTVSAWPMHFVSVHVLLHLGVCVFVCVFVCLFVYQQEAWEMSSVG